MDRGMKPAPSCAAMRGRFREHAAEAGEDGLGGGGGDALLVLCRPEDAADFAKAEDNGSALRGVGFGFRDDDVGERAYLVASGF